MILKKTKIQKLNNKLILNNMKILHQYLKIKLKHFQRLLKINKTLLVN